MAELKNEESFRVVDRRLFTSEGELRPEIVEQQTREQSQTQKSAPSADSGAEKQTSAASKTQAPVQEAATVKPDRNFQLLIDLLARNAAALLGGVPDPATGQAYLDLEGAHEMIDMLDALREKTHGNLAPEEQSLLSDVLGSLKLSYMEISKAAAKKMREGAKGAR